MSRCSKSSPCFVSLIFLSFFPSHPNTLFLLLLRPRLRVLFLLLFLNFLPFCQKVSQTDLHNYCTRKVCSSSEKVHTCKISIFEESEERKKKKEKNNNNSSNNNICIATDR